MGIKLDTTQFIIPPGETIKEQLAYLGMSQKELATRMNYSEKAISKLINGKVSLTTDTALELENIFGIPAVFWINLDANYQLRKKRQEDITVSKSEIDIARRYKCYAEISNRGYVKKTSDWHLRVKELCRFFGVSNLGQIMKLDYGVAFKQASSRSIDSYSVQCLLRIGELEAQDISVPDFNKEGLKELIPQIRSLITLPIEEAIQNLRVLLNSVGVRLVLTPSISKTMINGAVKWSDDRPTIQVTDYKKAVDIFWFTIFHELGHVLLHGRGKGKRFVDTYSNLSSKENIELEANQFAQNTLIPEDAFNDFIENGSFYEADIIGFSAVVGIPASIIAGRLAHDKSITQYGYNFAQKFRTSIDLTEINI
ncbi:MAG: putative HTH-type transcriptional regulator YddM [candidate division WS6 bacterium OLB20]|uniref:Putative HTH-type transcriptional regulator YddM n=1 Tax=candidate division WS6 bacterium OLB20 TaxID=1617426 RepID=A0A136LZ22_9BACT|nr:MAG: putative HTH-type transcriptional regulator YddM [candidate division WS6 bacterium OLB20]